MSTRKIEEYQEQGFFVPEFIGLDDYPDVLSVNKDFLGSFLVTFSYEDGITDMDVTLLVENTDTLQDVPGHPFDDETYLEVINKLKTELTSVIETQLEDDDFWDEVDGEFHFTDENCGLNLDDIGED